MSKWQDRTGERMSKLGSQFYKLRQELISLDVRVTNSINQHCGLEAAQADPEFTKLLQERQALSDRLLAIEQERLKAKGFQF